MHQHSVLELLGDGLTVSVSDEIKNEGRDGRVRWIGSKGGGWL